MANSYGNYLDPKQNHKDPNRNTEQYHLVNRARYNDIKHPGSKSIKQLRSYK